MSLDIQKNEMHYYVNLLRMRDSEQRSLEQTASCVKALHNTIRTMKFSRHDKICGEDFTSLDWGNIPFNGTHFSLNGDFPCDFSGCTLREINFRNLFMNNDVNVVAVSNDCRYALTCHCQNTAYIWDAVSGRIHTFLEGHSQKIRCATFTDDGKYCITGSNDCTAKIWDVETGLCESTLRGHTGYILNVFYSSKIDRVFTLSADKSIKAWGIDGAYIQTIINNSELLNWDEKSSYKTLGGFVDFIQHIPLHCTSTSEYECKLYIDSIHKHSPNIFHSFWSSSFSNDTNLLALKKIEISKEGTYRDVKNLSLVKNYSLHIDEKWCLISPLGNYCLTVAPNNGLYLWDLNIKRKMQLIGHKDRIVNVCFSLNEHYIITGSKDKTAIIWDAMDGSIVQTIMSHMFEIESMDMASNVDRYVCSRYQNLWFFYFIKNKCRYHKMPHKTISIISISPKGNLLFLSYEDNTAELWNLPEKRLVCSFDTESIPIAGFFSQNEKFLLVQYFDWFSHIINTTSGEIKKPIDETTIFSTPSFSNNSEYIMIGKKVSSAQLYNIETGDNKLVIKLQEGRITSCLLFNEMKRCMLGISFDNQMQRQIQIWNIEKADNLYCERFLTIDTQGFVLHDINNLSFSPDGHFIIAYVYIDYIVHFIDAISFEHINQISPPKKSFKRVFWKPPYYIIVFQDRIVIRKYNLSSVNENEIPFTEKTILPIDDIFIRNCIFNNTNNLSVVDQIICQYEGIIDENEHGVE